MSKINNNNNFANKICYLQMSKFCKTFNYEIMVEQFAYICE